MNLKQFSKKHIVISLIVIGVLLVVFVFVMLRRSQSSSTTTGPKPTLSDEAPIPTVDGSVLVDLVQKVPGKEVLLTVSHLPADTTSIEYSLTYDTKKQNAQGVIGTIQVTGSTSQYEKQITLGTCSSGTCIYHEVIGPITVSLKFNGSYGEKVFEKDFSSY